MYYKNYLRNRQLENGFTLLEVIVAVSVITIGTMGVFTVISNTLSANKVNAPRLTAAYLAQEGLEIVRNIRDGNWLEGRSLPSPESTPIPWNDGIGAGEWEADYASQGLVDDYDGDYLNVDDANGLYSYSSGVPTKIKRKITISDVIDLTTPPDGKADVFTVSVLVECEIAGKTYPLSAKEKLYNWLR